MLQTNLPLEPSYILCKSTHFLPPKTTNTVIYKANLIQGSLVSVIYGLLVWFFKITFGFFAEELHRKTK